jgi:integrase
VVDDSIKEEYRMFLICCVSAGLRVSEALSITKECFNEDERGLFFEVKVLKKRKVVTRWCMIDPDAVALVKKVLKEKIGKLFDWTTMTCLRRAKALFDLPGICNHSLRHSAVSYYLFEKNLSAEIVGKIIHITPYIVNYYAHLDERAFLSNMHKNRAV